MRILFVDNHLEFTGVVRRAFLAAHEIVVVPTVAGARVTLAGSDFDAVLVDHDLDDGTGVELVRWARAARIAIPLIAVSARPDGNDALVRAGADRVCAKRDFARIEAILAELRRGRVDVTASLNEHRSSARGRARR